MIHHGHGKTNFLFSNLTVEQRKSIQMDDEALFSVTDCRTADLISEKILALQDVDVLSRLTDLTACVGGNTISFAAKFAHINAVEINARRHEMLIHNVKDVVGCYNVDFVHGDGVRLFSESGSANRPVQDIIFIDPPWGGAAYKSSKQLDLSLGGVDLGELVEQHLRHFAKYVVLKLPGNFDVDHFRGRVSGTVTIHRDLRKMILLVVDCRVKY